MTIRALFVLRFAGIALILGQLAVWYPRQAVRDDDSDFAVYYHAAVKASQHEAVYGETRPNLYARPRAFFYPPTFLVIIAPFTKLSIATATKVWFGLILGAYWLFAWALARLAFVHIRADHVLAVGTAIQFLPWLYTSMGLGNVDIVVWALVAWAIVWVNLPARSVVLLALASWIKVYPVLGFMAMVGVCLSGDVHSKRLRYAVTVGSICSTFVVLALHRHTSEWIRIGLPSVTSGCFDWANWSLTTLVLRPFVDANATALPDAARWFIRLSPVVGTAATVWFARRAPVRVFVTSVIVAALMLSPVCWANQVGLGGVLLALWWQSRHQIGPHHVNVAMRTAW